MITRDATQDDGAVASEYAVMASLIAVVVLGVVTQLGAGVLTLFAAVAGL